MSDVTVVNEFQTASVSLLSCYQ